MGASFLYPRRWCPSSPSCLPPATEASGAGCWRTLPATAPPCRTKWWRIRWVPGVGGGRVVTGSWQQRQVRTRSAGQRGGGTASGRCCCTKVLPADLERRGSRFHHRLNQPAEEADRCFGSPCCHPPSLTRADLQPRGSWVHRFQPVPAGAYSEVDGSAGGQAQPEDAEPEPAEAPGQAAGTFYFGIGGCWG